MMRRPSPAAGSTDVEQRDALLLHAERRLVHGRARGGGRIHEGDAAEYAAPSDREPVLDLAVDERRAPEAALRVAAPGPVASVVTERGQIEVRHRPGGHGVHVGPEREDVARAVLGEADVGPRLAVQHRARLRAPEPLGVHSPGEQEIRALVRIERVIARLMKRVQGDPGEAVVRGIEPFGAAVRVVARDDRRRRRWIERLVHHVPVQVEVVSDPGVRVPGDAPEGGLVDPHVLEPHRLTRRARPRCPSRSGGTRRSPASPRSRVHRSAAPATGSGRPPGAPSRCVR